MAEIHTPRDDRFADTCPRDIVNCECVTGTRTSPEVEQWCTVVRRNLSSTGQRHHINLQNSSNSMSAASDSCWWPSKKRSSCWIPVDWWWETSSCGPSSGLSEIMISHTARQRHVLSSYWRTCDHSTRWLWVWNTTQSDKRNISLLVLLTT